MWKYLLFLSAIISRGNCLDAGESPCTLKLNVTSEHVIQFCEGINGTLVRACCHLTSNNTFPAIDLSDANLTTFPRLDFIHNFANSVVLMDFRSNPSIKSWRKHDFFNLTSLDRLILSNDLPCPGGLDAWQSIDNLTEENAIQCMHQKNICPSLVDPCPESISECRPSGPNAFSCFCKAGYYGYKCLRSGQFPWVALLAPTGAVTVVASALLFWTQRRHVKK